MADNESSIKRILPHDNDAERGIIGSMMMDPDAISDVSGFLVKEDFYNIQYGLLFDAMCSIFNEGKQVDQITLSEKLRQMGAPEEIYKLEYLSDILAGQQTSAFVMNYAGIVRDKATLRNHAAEGLLNVPQLHKPSFTGGKRPAVQQLVGGSSQRVASIPVSGSASPFSHLETAWNETSSFSASSF